MATLASKSLGQYVTDLLTEATAERDRWASYETQLYAEREQGRYITEEQLTNAAFQRGAAQGRIDLLREMADEIGLPR